MSTLVEMIEALQREWQSTASEYEILRKDCILQCADNLDLLLAAAREQEQELAAMKEPMACGHPSVLTKEIKDFIRHHAFNTWAYPMWRSERDWAEHEEKGIWIPLAIELSKICSQQHSADLREIAEMARLSCKNIIINQCREHGNWKKDGAPSKILRAEASDLIDGLSPDSIVREFREKKEKVGK